MLVCFHLPELGAMVSNRRILNVLQPMRLQSVDWLFRKIIKNAHLRQAIFLVILRKMTQREKSTLKLTDGKSWAMTE